MTPEPFILDLESNPHPKMLEAAIRYRRLAHATPGEPVIYRYWQGYLEAMCDATGLPPEQIDAWVARHTPDVGEIGKRGPASVPVQIGGRR